MHQLTCSAYVAIPVFSDVAKSEKQKSTSVRPLVDAFKKYLENHQSLDGSPDIK